jgi:hypothetical protein
VLLREQKRAALESNEPSVFTSHDVNAEELAMCAALNQSSSRWTLENIMRASHGCVEQRELGRARRVMFSRQ